MSQPDAPGFATSPGYALKRAQAALHARMDAELRPLGLSVSQYACLEQLHRQPGLSHAELARLTFVTRQSANVVLRGLEERGLLGRDHAAATGRAVPTTLTPAGAALVRQARTRVQAVDDEVTAALGRHVGVVVRSLVAAAATLEAGA